MLIPDAIIELDRGDTLKRKREEFLLLEDSIYMDGNSLGPLTIAAKKRVATTVSQQWGDDLVHSWNAHHWIDLPVKVGNKIGRLIGAENGQVIACDSTSVNIFKVLVSALSLNPGRRLVLSQKDNFPTDLYMAQGLSALLGAERCELKSVSETLLLDSLDETVAVLMLTQVNFRTGRLHDMRELTKRAHDKGILVIWDLAHSAGALELFVDDCNVDFAVGCGYKYLNGGPGAPAFIYAARKHHKTLTQPLTGWMGHSAPFAFEQDYKPGEAMLSYLSGTPNILSMVALDAALDVFSDITLAEIRHKSIGISEFFIQCIESAGTLNGLKLISPKDANLRGSQLAYTHEHAFAISQALIEHKVVVDFRAPNIVRFGFTPLYLSYQNVWTAAQRFISIIENKTYADSKYQALHNKVT